MAGLLSYSVICPVVAVAWMSTLSMFPVTSVSMPTPTLRAAVVPTGRVKITTPEAVPTVVMVMSTW